MSLNGKRNLVLVLSFIYTWAILDTPAMFEALLENSENILHNYVNLTQTEKSHLPPFVYILLHTNFARDAIGK